jgi:uncharacterized membrane protein YphA (DoxX/SURF4 family)
LLPDGREHSGSDPNDLNGLNIAAMFVVSALDKFRLDPVEMGQISPCVCRPRCTGSTDGICEMVGAAALSMCVYSRIAAVALALFVAFVSLAFVQFWSIGRPADARVMVRNLFIGNVAIVSGLLYVAVAGAGRLTLLDI